MDDRAAGGQSTKTAQFYVDNDARLWSAKQQYATRIASIFMYLFPQQHAWAEFCSATEGYTWSNVELWSQCWDSNE